MVPDIESYRECSVPDIESYSGTRECSGPRYRVILWRLGNAVVPDIDRVILWRLGNAVVPDIESYSGD